ncbi:1-acyl-sn-glycerol-3-phosphate acyltransferase [Marinobacter nauticus]
MAWIRLPWRLTAFMLVLLTTSLAAVAIGIVSVARQRPVDRPQWASRCFRLMCHCLGWQIRVHGQPPSGGRVLLVANHISWVDIPVLGSVVPTRFLSKAEVGRWPVIGWLARQGGTLFINRGSGRSGGIRGEIAGVLQRAEPVTIFPEGTTSSGRSVLPIHGRLLGAALDTEALIQPVSIGYRRQGRPDDLAPFVGDDDFLGHLIRLLKQPPTHIEVLFHAPVAAGSAQSTKALASQLHQTLNSGLAAIHSGQLDTSPQGRIRTMAGPG